MSVEQDFLNRFKDLLDEFDVRVDIVPEYDFDNNPNDHYLKNRVEIISKADKITFFIPDFIEYLMEPQ